MPDFRGEAPVARHPTGPRVEVRRFAFDWGAGEPGDVTAARFGHLGDALHRGAWFLNPVAVVHAAVPCRGFFAAAVRARDRWLGEVRAHLGNGGLRDGIRRAEREGRRVACLPDETAGAPPRVPSRVRLADLPPVRRREALESGQFARQLGYSGIMIIDGRCISPRTWGALASQLTSQVATRGDARRRDDAIGQPATTRRPSGPIVDHSGDPARRR